jgi:hypothetical protein
MMSEVPDDASMKTVTVSYSTYAYKLADIPEPRIRSAKEWRRYQVAMKRLRRRIDDHFMRSVYGARYGCNPPPESYPPKPRPRWSWLDISNVS